MCIRPRRMVPAKQRLRSRGLSAFALLLAASAAAKAQSIDYGSLEQLFGEPVTTSVTGSPQRVSDVPATMEIVTADEIRRSGATDIPGVLRHVAGIDVLQWTTDQADIGIRGYDQADTPRLLVLIDGRQVYADFFGFTPWSTLPVELGSIRQIEIVKGPASALFGFNAAGGVINIVTYNPLYDEVNTASLVGGTQGLAQGSAVGTVKLGDIGAVRLSAGLRANHDFSTPLPTASLGSQRIGQDRGAVDVDAMMRVADNAQLRVEASHTTSDQTDIIPSYVFGAFHYDADSLLAQLNADTSYGLIQTTAYSNWLHAMISAPTIAGTADFHNQVTVVQLQDIFKPAPDHTLRGTIEYRHNASNTTPIGGADIFYDVFSLGGMWSWAIEPSLSLTNAVRLDNLWLGRSGSFPMGFPLTNADWNRSIVQPAFNSGLVWKVTDDDTLRFTVGQGAQLPSLVEFGAILVQTPPVAFTGSPSLQPETVRNYELGWDHRLTSLGARLRSSVFHQESHDILDIAGGFLPGAVVPTSTPINGGRSTATGIEVAFDGTFLDDWRWGLSYRLESVDDSFPAGLTNTSTVTDFQHTTPVHLVKAHLGWSQGPWEIDGYLDYQSRVLGFSSATPQLITLVPVDDYVTLDGRVAYKLTDHVTLALSGQNLGTSPQQQTSGPRVQRRVFGWINVGF